ncbi:MAG: alpha-ribazole phosphatase [Clostridium sp.]|nr:alpha-ribazole phosphatase [Clostridium sp.]
MITLYMARHGETKSNKDKVYYGWTDVPLTCNGVKQCEGLRDKLCNVDFDVVISSSLERALNSAEIIGDVKRECIAAYAGLKELNFGKWEELHYKDIEEKYNDDWNCWTHDWENFCIPEGESFSGLYKRVKTCLYEILEKYKDKTILLVCHQGTLRIISTILLNMKVSDYWSFTFEFGMFTLFEIQEDLTIIKKINI